MLKLIRTNEFLEKIPSDQTKSPSNALKGTVHEVTDFFFLLVKDFVSLSMLKIVLLRFVQNNQTFTD